MTRGIVIRFPFRLAQADRMALKRLEEEQLEMAVGGRIGPEAERQVRCSSGELYNLDSLRERRHGPGFDPDLPPAGAAAIGARGRAA